MIIKSIEALDERFRPTVKAILKALEDDPLWKRYGYHPLVLETRRLLVVQMAYAARGRFHAAKGDAKSAEEWIRWYFKKAGIPWLPTDAECSVPSTQTLESKHIDGLAADVAPSLNGEVADWKAPDEVWERMAFVVETLGAVAGRRWKSKDSPHIEYGGQ